VRCARIRKLLHAYVDDELSADLRGEVATHLQCCPLCRQAWARLMQLGDLLRAAPLPALADEFASRVLARTHQRVVRVASAGSFSSPRRRWRTTLRVVRGMAAVLVLGIGLSAGLVMGWQASQQPAAAAQTPSASPTDPVVAFKLDYLGSTPEGSLPKAYLNLMSAQEPAGE